MAKQYSTSRQQTNLSLDLLRDRDLERDRFGFFLSLDLDRDLRFHNLPNIKLLLQTIWPYTTIFQKYKGKENHNWFFSLAVDPTRVFTRSPYQKFTTLPIYPSSWVVQQQAPELQSCLMVRNSKLCNFW